MTRQQEIDALKGQAEYLEDILDGLRRRIEELQPKAKEV
jgi:prefoldin subunit 5